MTEAIVAAIIIVGLSVVLLSVRIICGKKNFVSSHIDDNKALNDKGICCAKQQDREQRSRPSLRIREHS